MGDMLTPAHPFPINKSVRVDFVFSYGLSKIIIPQKHLNPFLAVFRSIILNADPLPMHHRCHIGIIDIIQNLFPDKSKDFVININENDIAIVKEVRNNIESKDLEKLARSISDSLSTELYTHVLVGIGTTIEGIKDLARSFKEAQIALEVGKVFDNSFVKIISS